jgi:hypothetical protein
LNEGILLLTKRNGNDRLPPNYDGVEFDNFEKYDGYCFTEGVEYKEEHWAETGISNIDECAQGCQESSTCSAFTIYHEDEKCYFYQLMGVARAVGDKAFEGGVCFIKDV